MEKNNYILILKEDLKKKNLILDKIILANQKQADALDDPNLDPDDFDHIVEEKANLIEQLEKLDDGFEQVYARVREELQDNKDAYKEDIALMQKMIRQLTDKSATIQVQEMRNKDKMTQKFAAIKKQVREIRSSQKVVNQYYRNMMKTNYIDPQFWTTRSSVFWMQ